jgi:hypothetical protein
MLYCLEFSLHQPLLPAYSAFAAFAAIATHFGSLFRSREHISADEYIHVTSSSLIMQTANGRHRPGIRARHPSTGTALASAIRQRECRRCTCDAGNIARPLCRKRSLDNQGVVAHWHRLHVNSCKLLAFRRRRHNSCRAVVQALGAAKFWIPMPRIGTNRGKFIGT